MEQMFLMNTENVKIVNLLQINKCYQWEVFLLPKVTNVKKEYVSLCVLPEYLDVGVIDNDALHWISNPYNQFTDIKENEI